MPLTDEEKEIILKTYTWIKVAKYKDDESLSWEERYKKIKRSSHRGNYFSHTQDKRNS
jgi:hypothetical protein